MQLRRSSDRVVVNLLLAPTGHRRVKDVRTINSLPLQDLHTDTRNKVISSDVDCGVKFIHKQGQFSVDP